MRLTHVAAVCGAIVSVLGCTDLAPLARNCNDDSACGDNRVCALGVCVDPNDQRLSTVDFEVDASAAGLPVQDKQGVDLKGSTRVDVALAAGALWSGVVQHSGHPIAAQVLARPERSIPGRVLAPAANSDDVGAFSLTVVEGQRYFVNASPIDPSLPPLYGSDAQPVRGDDDSLVIDVASGAVTVSGVVKAGVGQEAQGIPELSVEIDDANGRRVSSAATTGADGSFSVALAASDTSLTLTVTPTAANAFFPSFHEPVDAKGDFDLGVVDLGEVLSPATFSAHVKDADGSAVEGATALVSAPIGNGAFAATLTSGPDGALDAQLPPGTYTIVCYGPAGAASAGLLVTDQVDVPSTASDVELNLQARVRYAGTVRDHDGAAEPGATVTAVRIGGVDGAPEPLLAGTLIAFQGVAGADGSFAIPVDPGLYRVSAAPPLGSDAPASSERVPVPAAGLERDVNLPARAVVAGNVVFQGAPVAGAYVRVFTTDPLVDESGNAILLGEGTAGPDGSFALVVPDLVADVQNPTPP